MARVTVTGPIIKRYVTEGIYDDLNDADLAKLIYNQERFFDLPYTIDACRQAIRYHRNKSNRMVEIKTNPKDDHEPLQVKYVVQNGEYTFNAKKGTFSLSVGFIDQLFYEFSMHGLDMQTTELIRKHKLQPWQWFALKNALRLYKVSDIFSPYTVENTPDELLSSMIEDKMKGLAKDINHQVVKQYNRTIHKEFKEVIRKQSLRDYAVETIMTELYEWLPNAEIVPKVPITIDRSGDEISVFIADIHFGGKNNSKTLSMFSPEVLETVFDQIANIINQQKAAKVNLFFLGDLIESFSGLNHLDSWRGMAEGYWGAELVKKCYQFLVRFISKINNVSKILGVAGNHDRSAASKSEDPDGYIADIIFEFLKVVYRDKIEVIFDKRMLVQEVDDVVIIMSHGHEKISNMNAAELIINYGNQHKFNLLVSGHLHNRQIKGDNSKFRQIVCPSIIPGNNYSEGAGFGYSQSGFLMARNNGFGKIILTDYSL